VRRGENPLYRKNKRVGGARDLTKKGGERERWKIPLPFLSGGKSRMKERNRPGWMLEGEEKKKEKSTSCLTFFKRKGDRKNPFLSLQRKRERATLTQSPKKGGRKRRDKGNHISLLSPLRYQKKKRHRWGEEKAERGKA